MTNLKGQTADFLAIVRPEPCTDGSLTWLAYHPDLPGCMAHADTPDEALANLNEAHAMVLRHLREHGITQPKPGSSTLARTILADAGVA